MRSNYPQKLSKIFFTTLFSSIKAKKIFSRVFSDNMTDLQLTSTSSWQTWIKWANVLAPYTIYHRKTFFFQILYWDFYALMGTRFGEMFHQRSYAFLPPKTNQEMDRYPLKTKWKKISRGEKDIFNWCKFLQKKSFKQDFLFNYFFSFQAFRNFLIRYSI